MLIQDLQYIENIELDNEVKGRGLFETWKKYGGNVGDGKASSVALGANTYTDSGAKVEILQGIGSSSETFARGYALG